jgi:hypothetical protein
MADLFQMTKAAVAALAVALSMPGAHGQDKVMQTEVGHFVQTSGGQPALCGVENITVIADHTYRNDGLTVATTSLNWHVVGDNLGVIVKVSGFDFDASNPSKKAQFKVNQAFLAIKGAPVAMGVQFRPCEDGLSLCGAYGLPDSASVYEAAMQDSVSIGFNRSAGGLDVVVPFKYAVPFKTAADQQDFNAFRICITQLTAELRARLAKP